MQHSYRQFDGYPQHKTYVSTTPLPWVFDTTHQVSHVSTSTWWLCNRLRSGKGLEEVMMCWVPLMLMIWLVSWWCLRLPSMLSIIGSWTIDKHHATCCGTGMFIPDPGSDFFPSRIPDPNCLHPGSRILIKKVFQPKKTKKMVSKLLNI
jgi:hypothetical protein